MQLLRSAIALNLPSSPAIALQQEGIVDISPTIEKVRYDSANATLPEQAIAL